MIRIVKKKVNLACNPFIHKAKPVFSHLCNRRENQIDCLIECNTFWYFSSLSSL